MALMGVWWYEAGSEIDGGVLVGGWSVGRSVGRISYLSKQSTGRDVGM